ncbi:MAG: choice-of-anchor J domain-containing protein [Prevotellaceae bacterium]|nr:choice-of-anchor J domain-containing protein [Prevotellaceae bacterium]
MKRFYFLFIAILFTTALQAQSRDINLTIVVSTPAADNLQNQPVVLTQTDYQVGYGTLTLNASGICTVRVYAGHHNLSVNRDGYAPLSVDFDVQADTTVNVTLQEKTRTPFALTANPHHNAYTGENSVTLTWNTEAPVFFDDFESYDAFAIQFGEWTGIDADHETAAAIIGNYPNRGTLQYAQVINPLTVEPTWWYDYPVLRPYSGQQYIGFTRTQSGNANDDWLISPTITPGTDHCVSFLAKAADRFDERFQVYITTNTTNPTQQDFTRLDAGNYETADLSEWHTFTYSLAEYANTPVKIAIRYISHYNMYGSFMLMLDDFYVGPRHNFANAIKQTARRAPQKSPDNPNETFQLYVDGTMVATTDAYTYTFDHVTAGTHTFGVKAIYLTTESELVTTTVDIPADIYANVTFNVKAESKRTADGELLTLVNTSNSESYQLTIADGKATLPSLPFANYLAHIEEGAFDEYQQQIQVTGDATFDITLSDHVIAPYNITADLTEETDGTIAAYIQWNQELAITDSFESYDDFATGTFGDWISIDNDKAPVYPIALNGAIVTFPGSGTQYNPMPLAPMVFNPWNTVPAMLPTDNAVAAPTGDKTVIFFSPQRMQADKWLISPEYAIRDNFKLNVTAKGYESLYPESIEFCVSTSGTNPSDFTPLSVASPLASDYWMIYQTDLSDYAGQTVRLAIHYTSIDAFFAQIDDFTVGPEEGDGATIDYGNVVKYEIYLDGILIGTSDTTNFTLTGLTAGTHTVGIRAIYQYSESSTTEYVINATTDIQQTTLPTIATTPSEIYNLQGMKLQTPVRGINIIRQGNSYHKVIK